MRKLLVVDNSAVDDILDTSDCRRLLPFLVPIRDNASTGCCGRRKGIDYGAVKRSLAELELPVLIQLKGILDVKRLRFIYRLDGRTVTREV